MRRVETTEDTPQTQGINAAISEQRARVLRAQRDYDEELIEARDLKRIRDAADARVGDLETQRLMRGRAGGLAPILGAADPAAAFREASLAVRREVIDTLAIATLRSQPRGRRGVDPASIEVVWR